MRKFLDLGGKYYLPDMVPLSFLTAFVLQPNECNLELKMQRSSYSS